MSSRTLFQARIALWTRGRQIPLVVGPINLLFALPIPGYHPEVSPSAKWVPNISWVLVIIPVVLFLASWWLRKPVKSFGVVYRRLLAVLLNVEAFTLFGNTLSELSSEGHDSRLIFDKNSVIV